jgi:hypothetical protein
MANKTRVITATFSDAEKARQLYDHFRGRGYSEDEINLLMSESTQTQVFAAGVHPPQAMGPGHGRSQIAETAASTAVGSFAGLAAGLAISAALPGLGLVLLGPLVGAGTGAMAGGAVGALHGLAVAREEEKAVHDVLDNGGVLLGIVPKDGDVDGVRKELIEHGAVDIRVHNYND